MSLQLNITCSGAVDLSPGRDDDVDAVGVGVGVRAGDVRREEVEVDVVSTGRKTEHQTALLKKTTQGFDTF